MGRLRTTLANSWAALRSNPSLAFGVGILVTLVGFGLIGDYLIPDRVITEVRYDRALQSPTLTEPFGTDDLGRSLFLLSLESLSTDVTLVAGIIGASLLIGVVVGGIAGTSGGVIDESVMRLTDVFFAIPPFVLAMAVASVLGRELVFLGIALVVATWPPFSRLVRGQLLKEREEPYVDALRILGFSRFRIIVRHLLPNALVPVLIYAVTISGVTMLYLAGLSYVGFGPGSFVPELGLLIARGQRFIFQAPWAVFGPGVLLATVVLGFSLVGEGLRTQERAQEFLTERELQR